jgi:hypothetical protein
LRGGDGLVVWKLDRLGRSLSHLVRILDDLKGRGVAFRSLTEGIDTTTSHGEFLYNLFGTLAPYGRSLIRERVNAGLAAARRRGRRGGRSPATDPETIEQTSVSCCVSGWSGRHGNLHDQSLRSAKNAPASDAFCSGQPSGNPRAKVAC